MGVAIWWLSVVREHVQGVAPQKVWSEFSLGLTGALWLLPRTSYYSVHWFKHSVRAPRVARALGALINFTAIYG